METAVIINSANYAYPTTHRTLESLHIPGKKIAGLKQLNPIYIRILIDYILTQQYAVCHYDRYLSHDS